MVKVVVVAAAAFVAAAFVAAVVTFVEVRYYYLSDCVFLPTMVKKIYRLLHKTFCFLFVLDR